MTLSSTALDSSTATTHPADTKTHHSPLKATELLKHPAFKTNDWSSKIPPSKTGFVPINSNASCKRPGGPFNIAYDIHGTGPTKIVFIMGLGAFSTAWKRQSKYFGHDSDRGSKYSCLVFDNRGIGRSGKPVCRYSTKEMAADVVELLGGIGWLDKRIVDSVMGRLYSPRSKKGRISGADAAAPDLTSSERDLVVCGVSMGGMIAQELALLIPEQIRSLILVSTFPRMVRTVPFLENLRQRINMFIPRDVDVQLEEVAHRLFSREFLEAKDQENEDESMNFPTNRDRFAASELAKRMDKEGFTRLGFICQAIAAGWHFKSRDDLREMVDKVGPNRIFVMHGTGDRMITYRHFEILEEDMGKDSGVKFRTWDGMGHVLMWEQEVAFNKAVEEFIEETRG